MSIQNTGHRMPSMSRREARRLFLLRTGALLLLLGLIAFSIYQCTGHVTMGLSTLRTQEITEASYTRMNLYVFRDETPVTMNGNLFAYDVRDGQRIGVGDTVATAYTVDDTEVAERQAWLTAYPDRVALATAMAQGGTPADVRRLEAAIEEIYPSVLEASDRGDLAGMFGYADVMLDKLNQYQALTGGREDASFTVTGLAAQRADRLNGLTATDSLTATESGYFYYQTDGYEAAFDYDAALTMTPEEFLTLTETKPAPAAPQTAGKMVWRTGWYAAAYISSYDAACFADRVGTTYDMTCTDQAGTVIPMTLERLEPHGDGAMVVFRAVSMPSGFAFDRCIGVETVAHTVSGYRIPTEAVVTLTGTDNGDERGVYILVGNVVEFRKLRVLVDGEGYLIAMPYEDVQAMLAKLEEEDPDAYAAEEADGWLYLDLNDNIITRGTGLYEGKTVG